MTGKYILQEESYTSQCPPSSQTVEERYAVKSNRKKRGLYKDGIWLYNADAVGAYNILRKYCDTSNTVIDMSISGLSNTQIIKAAV